MNIRKREYGLVVNVAQYPVRELGFILDFEAEFLCVARDVT